MRYLSLNLLVLLATSLIVSCASVRATELAESCPDAKESVRSVPIENALLLCSPVMFMCSST